MPKGERGIYIQLHIVTYTSIFVYNAGVKSWGLGRPFADDKELHEKVQKKAVKKSVELEQTITKKL